ncbi:MAG: carboxypeptidase-like regulatory domain-containing protein [Verrucomicrobiota bacterium]|nr:carboxypeptidase-like regulatory domain-containing protein [Verrucomicrobiota bacterium]
MKKLALLIITLLLANASIYADPDLLVQQGRVALIQRDIDTAHARFAAALDENPAHPEANALHAFTRLLRLPNSSPASEFLTQLGVPLAGRNVYRWDASLPKNTNGEPILPQNLAATNLTQQFRNLFLPQLIGAMTNFAAITSPDFEMTLSSNETSFGEIVFDHADTLLLRSALSAFEYLSYTLYSWDYDDLIYLELKNLIEGGATIEVLLQNYPNLFTVRTLTDLPAAKTAFNRAIDTYMLASTAIRNRDTNLVRLFTWDPESDEQELHFRELLADLQLAQSASRILTSDSNVTINLAPHFSDGFELRSFLPVFIGDEYLLGTAPDETFGGIVQGIGSHGADEIFSIMFDPLIVINNPRVSSGDTFIFNVTTLGDGQLGLESSSNLVDWVEIQIVSLTNPVVQLQASIATGQSRFYRAIDYSQTASIHGTVFAGGPLAGATVSAGGRHTISGPAGFYSLNTTIPYGRDITVTVSAPGYQTRTVTIPGSWNGPFALFLTPL